MPTSLWRRRIPSIYLYCVLSPSLFLLSISLVEEKCFLERGRTGDWEAGMKRKVELLQILCAYHPPDNLSVPVTL